MDCYQIFDIILGFLNLFVIIFIAYSGFNEWKKQQIMREKHEVAKNLLKYTQLLRNRMDYVRSPTIHSFEISIGLTNFENMLPKGPYKKK